MSRLILTPGLAQVLKGFEPSEWARNIAIEVRRNAGQHASLSLVMGPVLRARRIKGPVKAAPRLESTAKLVPTADGFRILVDQSLLRIRNRANWRFTIAHELGHTLFYDLDKLPPSRLPGLEVVTEAEERLCDLFATELLMPQALVREKKIQYERMPPLDALTLLAKEFDVSFGAMSIRLIKDLRLMNAILLVSRWLPEDNIDTGSQGKGFWRLSWSVFPEALDNELFIPRRLSPESRYPKLSWKILDVIAEECEGMKSRRVEIEARELGKVGSLRRALTKHIGLSETYCAYVSALDSHTGSGTRNASKYRPIRNLAIAIPLDERD